MSVSVSRISKSLRRKPVSRRSANHQVRKRASCRVPTVAPKAVNLAAVIRHARHLHRMRQDLLRAEISLTLQIKSVERRYCGAVIIGQLKKKPIAINSMKSAGFDKKTVDAVLGELKKRKQVIIDGTTIALVGDAVHRKFESEIPALHASGMAVTSSAPLIMARAQITPAANEAKKKLGASVEEMEIFKQFVEPISGFGALGLAQIIAEVGDFRNYDTVRRVWKRMGLAVIEGGRQRRVKGDDALAHGYSPIRRSIMWNIGESLIKGKNEYRALYLARKLAETKAAEARGLTVVPAAKITKKNADKHMSKMHVHNRSRRYVEKALLLDLWKKWREIYMPKES